MNININIYIYIEIHTYIYIYYTDLNTRPIFKIYNKFPPPRHTKSWGNQVAAPLTGIGGVAPFWLDAPQ